MLETLFKPVGAYILGIYINREHILTNFKSYLSSETINGTASSLSTHLKSHFLLIYHTFPSMNCTCGALAGLLRSLLPSPSCTMAVLTTSGPYAEISPAGPGKSFLRLWSTTPTGARKEGSLGITSGYFNGQTYTDKQAACRHLTGTLLELWRYQHIKAIFKLLPNSKYILNFNPLNYTRPSNPIFEGYRVRSWDWPVGGALRPAETDMGHNVRIPSWAVFEFSMVSLILPELISESIYCNR